MKGFGESLGSSEIPQTLIALDDDTFLGTVSVIENDMNERPQYRPWLAALWVEPAQRAKDVGAALVRAAAATAFQTGSDTLYLCATPDNVPFYLPLGRSHVEGDVAGLDILWLSR